MAESYSVEALLSAKDNGFTNTMNSAVKDLSNLTGETKTANKSVASMAIGFAAVQVGAKVFGVLANSMDAAISRFDTMERYPKVMSALGYSTDESTISVNKLSQGIDGLPTKLDDVVSTAQRMTAITGNLDKSTDATIALNNAMLASGASTADAERGLQQYVQMLSTGVVDLESWKTLQETMPIGLQKTAEAMGFVGETAQRDLYAALKDGDVTFREFQNQIIDLGTGTGELAELARVNSEGIATSFGNLKNAASKGLATVVTSFDTLSKKVTGKNIAKNLDSLKGVVNTTFKVIGTSIEATTPLFELAADGIKLVTDQGDILIPVLGGVAAGFAAWKAISTVNSIIAKTDSLMILAGLSGEKLTITTTRHMAAQIADTTATKADIAAKGAQNGMITISSAVIGVLTGSISASTVATTLMTAATTAFSTALKIATGPIGWVVAGVGALVAGGVALFKWLNKETDASKKLNKEQSALSESTKTLTDNTQNNVKKRKEELSTIETNSAAYQDLGDQITTLAAKEKLSKDEKKLLKDSVEQLNGSVAGLNLQYDEEGKMLSMSTEQLKARIEAQKNQETANQAQEDLLTILKEQHEVEAQLSETTALRDEWNKKLEEGTVKGKEHKEAMKELDDQEKTLTETQKALSAEHQNTQAVLTEANAAVTEAVENGTMRQVVSYQTLTDAQKTAVDGMKAKWQEYQEAATNMFDTLSDKQEMSVGEMQANLEENQRVISTWADNIATLASRGVDEGLLAKLRDAGPESAGYVAAMVSASDTELQNLSSTYAKGGETATSAFKTAWDTGAQGIDEKVTSMVFSAEESLTTAIQTADFKTLGEMVPKGAAEGVEAGSKDVATAAGDMAKGADEAFASEADIHSPSRVFHEHGTNIARGAEKGIKEGESAVTSAVRSMASKLPNEMNSLPSSFRSSGVNAMQGLADGIYAGSGSALSAARSIANQVAATINKALDIHSPSRVTRESGENTTDGLALGMMDRIRYVVSSAKKVARTAAENMQIRSQQSFDFAIAGGGYTAQSMSQVKSFEMQVDNRPIYVTLPDGRILAEATVPYMGTLLEKETDKAAGRSGRRRVK
ncbi:tape measure protein [Enterococcus sp. 2201sp1_2201st1_B8_2201SCRN_220225]|uniref:tape measure protein n=1 Tax=unclassified Enterococcus TaxID=2608891 RepID=UPI0034A54A0C